MIEIEWLNVIAAAIIVLFMIINFIVTKFDNKIVKGLMLVIIIAMLINFFISLFILLFVVMEETLPWVWMSYGYMALATLALLFLFNSRKEYWEGLKEQLQLSRIRYRQITKREKKLS